jgi:hypothetical protein
MILEKETSIQKLQRFSAIFVLTKIRQIFGLLHSSDFNEESLEPLENLIDQYRSLKTLLEVTTITPTTACLFFEVVQDAKDLVQKGLNPSSASGQSGERAIATTKE